MDPTNVQQIAFTHWKSGRPLEAGRLLFESLPPLTRPAWAARILRLVIARTGVEVAAIHEVVRVAEDPGSWAGGHKAFDDLRDVVLSLLRLRSRSADENMILKVADLAELVAKVTYNATDPPDEFDLDSGWDIATCVYSIVQFFDDSEFGHRAWSVLCFEQGKEGS